MTENITELVTALPWTTILSNLASVVSDTTESMFIQSPSSFAHHFNSTENINVTTEGEFPWQHITLRIDTDAKYIFSLPLTMYLI